jgi:ribosomal protein L1
MNNSPEIQKPPLGLRPRWAVDEQRLKEIYEAIQRYLEVSYTVPTEWFEEAVEIQHRLKDKPKNKPRIFQ